MSREFTITVEADGTVEAQTTHIAGIAEESSVSVTMLPSGKLSIKVSQTVKKSQDSAEKVADPADQYDSSELDSIPELEDVDSDEIYVPDVSTDEDMPGLEPTTLEDIIANDTWAWARLPTPEELAKERAPLEINSNMNVKKRESDALAYLAAAPVDEPRKPFEPHPIFSDANDRPAEELPATPVVIPTANAWPIADIADIQPGAVRPFVNVGLYNGDKTEDDALAAAIALSDLEVGQRVIRDGDLEDIDYH